MATSLNPQLLAALLKQYSNSRIITAGMASSLTWITYDFLLTFPQEYKYIWRSKFSLTKVVYLFLRFYPMGFIVSNLYIRSRANYSTELNVLASKFCKAYHWWGIMGVPAVTNITTNILLCMRLYALYNRKGKVLAFLLFIFLGSLCAELYVCVQYSINSTKGPGRVLPPPIPGCVPASIPTGFSAIIAWVPTVTAQGIFFLMSVFHILRSQTVNRINTGVSRWKTMFRTRPTTSTPLIVLFVRDGAVYFFLILLSLIMGLVIMIHNISLTAMAISFIMATYSFAGTRLILNLRESASRGLIGGNIVTWKETYGLQESSGAGRYHGPVFASKKSDNSSGADDSRFRSTTTTVI